MIWFLSLLALAAVFLIGIWFLHRYYAKATLETALVRTGMGGRRVVVDGGCLALPIVHQVQRVSMGTISFTTSRSGRDALMTQDQLRADVDMEFEFYVEPSEKGIATAAQALGRRIARGDGEGVHEVLAGPLANAMQNAAATRPLTGIHLDRSGYTDEVARLVGAHAERLGLVLVSASLVGVDQSDLSQHDESNAFNAQGMRKLAELVAEQRKTRVKVETEAEIAISESRLAQHNKRLEVQRAEREAEIAQSEHIARLEAESRARSEASTVEGELAAESARIDKDQRLKTAQVDNDEALRRAEMAAILALEEAKISNDIQLARKRTEEAEAKAAEEASRAQVLLAAEQVQAQKERAIAEREREISGLKQQSALELESEKVASDVEIMLSRAQAEARAAQAAAEAEKIGMQARAAGQIALNEAENTLSDAVLRMRMEGHKLDRMPEIMTQMMKPVEKIDSIRINQIGGAGSGMNGGDGVGVEGAFGAAMDQILGMAVRLPAMKQMGEEIGFDFDANLAGRTADYANRITPRDGKDKTSESKTKD